MFYLELLLVCTNCVYVWYKMLEQAVITLSILRISIYRKYSICCRECICVGATICLFLYSSFLGDSGNRVLHFSVRPCDFAPDNIIELYCLHSTTDENR